MGIIKGLFSAKKKGCCDMQIVEETTPSQQPEDLKQLVKKEYGKIAKNNKGCCSANNCGSTDSVRYEDYTGIKGHNPAADLGLGCGLPTNFAQIKQGDTVVDLGSGAGNDCFVARAETGEMGKVIGVDMTPEMIEKARKNVDKVGYTNVEFIQGDIENIPLEANTADIVVSNCVLNLVPNKQAVFNEIYRILKPSGHFSISDIVLTIDLPTEITAITELYSACVTGAIKKDLYLQYIKEAGFKNIKLQKEAVISIPQDQLNHFLTPEGIALYQQYPKAVASITVYAEK